MKVLKHAHVLKTHISGLSPESSVINNLPGRSSGLFPVYCLPTPAERDSGCSVNIFRFVTCRTHSYGDSAGFTPDFPFNPDFAGTRSAAKVMECGDF
jgi:hypothetical protein